MKRVIELSSKQFDDLLDLLIEHDEYDDILEQLRESELLEYD